MPDELRLLDGTDRSPSPTARDLLAVFFRQKRLAVIAFAVGFLAVIAYALIAPSYRSEMKVLLRRGRVDPVVAPTPSQAEFARQDVTEEDLNSEAELLHDDEILRLVARNAGMIPVTSSWFARLFGGDADADLGRTVRRLGRRLTVEPVRKTSLITVSYQSRDASQSVKVLQHLAEAYLERHHRVHRPSGEYEFFNQQVDEARSNLEAAELLVSDFSQREGVISAAQERDMALQRLNEAQADEQRTQVAMAENAERLSALQEKLKILPERTLTQVRTADNPQLLEKMKARLLELELNRTELLTKFEPSYRLVQQLDIEIQETKAEITAQDLTPIRDQTSDLEPNHAWAKAELTKAEVEAKALTSHVAAERDALATSREQAHRLGDRAIEQERLLSDLKEAEDKYLLYVNKREEARIGDALDQGGILNVAIAEQPTIPLQPVHSSLTMAFVALAFGGCLSVGAAFGADYLNPSFRTPDEVTAYLGEPVLASLPCETEEQHVADRFGS